MHVHDLVSLFDPAVLASIDSIPVAHRRVIDVAIGPVAGIQRDFVRAVRVTEQRRTVTGSCPIGGDKRIATRVLITALSVQIKTAAGMIYDPSHDEGLAQWTHLPSYRVQGDVRQ